MAKYIRPTWTAGVSDTFQDHVNRGSANPGTDYVVARGTSVVAPAGGRIVVVDNTFGGSGGRMIGLDTYDGDSFDFLHLSRIDVYEGQYVNQGQQIALSGASGFGSETGYGAHLHLSYRRQQGGHFYNSGNEDFEAAFRTQPAGDTGKPFDNTPAPAPVHPKDRIKKMYGFIRNKKTGSIAIVYGDGALVGRKRALKNAEWSAFEAQGWKYKDVEAVFYDDIPNAA